MKNHYEEIFVEMLEREGFTNKPKLSRVRHIVYQIVSEMIDEGHGVLSKDVASMVEPYLRDHIGNILRRLRPIDGQVMGNVEKKHGIKSISIVEALEKVYGGYDQIKWSYKFGKIVPVSSTILFRTNKGLEYYIKEHSCMRTVKVVECDFR